MCRCAVTAAAEHEPTILRPEDVARLVVGMRESDALFVLVLAYIGMRFGEAAGLQRRRVDPDGRRLLVALSLSDADGILSLEESKTLQHREVTLPAALGDQLVDHLAQRVPLRPDALVFASPAGMPMRHPNVMRRAWYPPPHDLRASHASWLYDEGWSPVEIAARLGHSKATVTTKHYARRMHGRDVEIAAGLDVMLRKAEDLGHARGTSEAS